MLDTQITVAGQDLLSVRVPIKQGDNDLSAPDRESEESVLLVCRPQESTQSTALVSESEIYKDGELGRIRRSPPKNLKRYRTQRRMVQDQALDIIPENEETAATTHIAENQLVVKKHALEKLLECGNVLVESVLPDLSTAELRHMQNHYEAVYYFHYSVKKPYNRPQPQVTDMIACDEELKLINEDIQQYRLYHLALLKQWILQYLVSEYLRPRPGKVRQQSRRRKSIVLERQPDFTRAHVFQLLQMIPGLADTYMHEQLIMKTVSDVKWSSLALNNQMTALADKLQQDCSILDEVMPGNPWAKKADRSLAQSSDILHLSHMRLKQNLWLGMRKIKEWYFGSSIDGGQWAVLEGTKKPSRLARQMDEFKVRRSSSA